MTKYKAVLSKRSYPATLDVWPAGQDIEFYDKGYGFGVPYIVFGLFGVGVVFMSTAFFKAMLGVHLQIAMIAGVVCILIGTGKSTINFRYIYNTTTHSLTIKIYLLSFLILRKTVVCDSPKVLVTHPCKLSLVPNGLASWNAHGLFFRLPTGERVMLACQPTFIKLLPDIEKAEAVFNTNVSDGGDTIFGRMAR